MHNSYFEPDESLQNILSDNFSGSEELLSKINNYLHLNIDRYNEFCPILDLIKKQTRDFPVIQNYLEELKSILDEENIISDRFFIDHQKSVDNDYDYLYSELRKITPNQCTIMTLSNSATIRAILRLLYKNNHKMKIIVCESRPKLEGRILAENLSASGIITNLIIEADIPNYLPECNFALVGADKILPDGSVVNKRGSRLLALICKVYAIPFYVVSRKNKITGETVFTENEKPKNEIWDTDNVSIVMKNLYFEVVEKELISKLIIS